MCPTIVNADDGDVISFGIRPTKAQEGNPDSYSFFTYSLNQGSTISDEALIINDGTVPVSLKVYAVDGVTAQNGGTSFAKEGISSSGGSQGTGEWLSFTDQDIYLEPDESLTLPFTVTVPDDATPGHHIAGLVVEAKPDDSTATNTDGDAQFQVNVIRRVGVAVVVDVPGTHFSELVISDLDLFEINQHGTIFKIVIANIGNVYTKGDGTFSIVDQNGFTLVSIPFTVDTILPGDQITLQITYPEQLSKGSYVLTADINYDGKTTSFKNEISHQIAEVEEEETAEVTSVPVEATETVVPTNPPAPSPTAYSTAPQSFDLDIRTLIIAAIVGLIIIFTVIEIVVWVKLWKTRKRK